MNYWVGFLSYLLACSDNTTSDVIEEPVVHFCGAAPIAEFKRHIRFYRFVMARIAFTFANVVRGREALPRFLKVQLVTRGPRPEGRAVRVDQISTSDSHMRASFVVGEARATAVVSEAAIPHHGEHVIAIGKDLGHPHHRLVPESLCVGAAFLAKPAFVEALREAPVLERRLLVPREVVHVLDRDERAAKVAADVVIAMPLNVNEGAAFPHRRRAVHVIACFRRPRLPFRRARSRTLWRIAVDPVVRQRRAQVEVRAHACAQRKRQQEDDGESGCHCSPDQDAADDCRPLPLWALHSI